MCAAPVHTWALKVPLPATRGGWGVCLGTIGPEDAVTCKTLSGTRSRSGQSGLCRQSEAAGLGSGLTSPSNCSALRQVGG